MCQLQTYVNENDLVIIEFSHFALLYFVNCCCVRTIFKVNLMSYQIDIINLPYFQFWPLEFFQPTILIRIVTSCIAKGWHSRSTMAGAPRSNTHGKTACTRTTPAHLAGWTARSFQGLHKLVVLKFLTWFFVPLKNWKFHNFDVEAWISSFISFHTHSRLEAH